MKPYLVLAFVLVTAATAAAQSSSFTAPVGRQGKTHVQREVPQQPSGTKPVGAFPRTARGNPLQLVNPLAPARYYGPPQETVVSAPYAHASTPRAREEPHYAGVILFGFAW